ncbi:hypothetical protein [Caballeronia ptereochthonis]|uniref:XRE family transcriptional regulator n=1 Tax=Caballeronia ptereochthonis TaxID=1777144 RepID=A0A158CPU4_9BURK|nr:hypothetical protein [Caballeronia ptereochthonis]SAK84271.1 XRE family transcriptional regulator [Caballeronia ptereochthonis]
MTTSAVNQIEQSITSEKHSPSLDILDRYATACGKTLRIAFV